MNDYTRCKQCAFVYTSDLDRCPECGYSNDIISEDLDNSTVFNIND